MNGFRAFALGAVVMAVAALLAGWSWVAIWVFALGGGDTMKWGSPSGAFVVGLVYSIPFILPSLLVGTLGVALWSRFSSRRSRLQVVVGGVVGGVVCVCCSFMGEDQVWAWVPWSWLLIGVVSGSAFALAAAYVDSWRETSEFGA